MHKSIQNNVWKTKNIINIMGESLLVNVVPMITTKPYPIAKPLEKARKERKGNYTFITSN